MNIKFICFNLNVWSLKNHTMDGGHEILNAPAGQAEGRVGQGVSTITLQNNTSALNKIIIFGHKGGAQGRAMDRMHLYIITTMQW